MESRCDLMDKTSPGDSQRGATLLRSFPAPPRSLQENTKAFSQTLGRMQPAGHWLQAKEDRSKINTR